MEGFKTKTYDKSPLLCNSPHVTYNVTKFITHYTISYFHLTTSVFRVTPMVHVTFRQALLLVYSYWDKKNAVSVQCGELQSEMCRLSKLNYTNEHLVGQYYVSGYYAVHVSSLFLKQNLIDILLISETHFTNKNHYTIPGYDLWYTCHPDGTAHGGTAIIIKNTLE